jgi:hypothetical protein
MLQNIKTTSLLALLLFTPVYGRSPEVVRTDWNSLQRQLGRQKKIKHVRVQLRSGEAIKTDVNEIRDDGLVIKRQRLIPKDQVASLRLSGRRGNGRLYGTLIGLGAGAGVGGAIAAGTSDINEGVFVIVRPLMVVAITGVGAVTGYFIGNAMDRQAPEFIVVQ